MIVAALSHRLAEALRRAGIPHVQRITLGDQSATQLQGSTGDLLILDPMELRGDALLTRTVAAAVTARGMRCAFFTEFSPDHMRAAAMAGVLDPLALWIAGIDDVAPQFCHRVLRLAGHQLVLETVDRLRPAVERLPWRLASVVVALFNEPERFFDASDVGRAAGMSRRSVDRHLVDGGFTTASRLIVGAKLLHAAARLQCPGTTVSEVAAALGYSAQEVLARQCLRVLGCRPGELSAYPATRLSIVLATFICEQVCPADDIRMPAPARGWPSSAPVGWSAVNEMEMAAAATNA